MKKFQIKPVSKKLASEIKHKIDFKTKPLGSLGVLEEMAMQICLIQQSLTPALKNPAIVVFAGDHGIVHEGVSAYPQEVTYQMVMNFLNGGAGINVFCKQNKIAIEIVDAGVNYDFPKELKNLMHCKIAHGTKSFLTEPAMTMEQMIKSIDTGAGIVRELHEQGCNIIGFGEMGIGNTASASALMSVICKIPIEECVGRGTGLDDEGVRNKTEVIRRAISFHKNPDSPFEALSIFGGFEIAQMVGAMLQSAELGMILMVDGFITTSAFMIAHAIKPAIKDYAIFCHQSGEQGHHKLLEYLSVQPLLNLGMRLGEGTGAAVAFPIICSAVAFMNEMASFESAGVSNKEENQHAEIAIDKVHKNRQ